MKNIIIPLAAIGLLAGCGKQQPDPRIAEMQGKITMLESNVTELYQRNENRRSTEILSTQALAMVYTNLTDIAASNLVNSLYLSVDEARLTVLENQYSNLCVTINARAGVKTMPVFAPSVNGIPSDVMAGIRAEAEKEWPTDYHMQNFVVKQQSEDWLKLHAQ
jgi:hypothetical protein